MDESITGLEPQIGETVYPVLWVAMLSHSNQQDPCKWLHASSDLEKLRRSINLSAFAGWLKIKWLDDYTADVGDGDVCKIVKYVPEKQR